MATFTIDNASGVDMSEDPFNLHYIGYADSGTSTATQSTITYGAQTWVFTGVGFGNFESGIPTTGTVTGIQTAGLNLSGISISLPNLVTLAAAADYPTLMGALFAGNDTIIGGGGFVNKLMGYGGDDTITGGASSEEILGNSGSDQIHGGGGNDVLRGGNGYGEPIASGSDMIYGDAGDDQIWLERGSVDGGRGKDFLHMNIAGSTNEVFDIAKAISAAGCNLGNGYVLRNIEGFNVNLGAGNDSTDLSREQPRRVRFRDRAVVLARGDLARSYPQRPQNVHFRNIAGLSAQVAEVLRRGNGVVARAAGRGLALCCPGNIEDRSVETIGSSKTR